MLILLGVFTGMFIVPVQVALQSRPPKAEKGRMIATMNQCSWVGIILGAIVYQASIIVLDMTGGPRSTIFAVTAALMLPVAIFYRPQDRGTRRELNGAQPADGSAGAAAASVCASPDFNVECSKP